MGWCERDSYAKLAIDAYESTGFWVFLVSKLRNNCSGWHDFSRFLKVTWFYEDYIFSIIQLIRNLSVFAVENEQQTLMNFELTWMVLKMSPA